MRHYYNHGLPFSEILGETITTLNKRIKLKKAVVVIVAGGLGEGKTTLSIEIADYQNKLYGLPPVDLSLGVKCPQYALGGKDFINKIKACYEKKLPVIIYDEAGDFSKRGALTQFNFMINRLFETFRTFNVMVILTLPDFDVLDSSLYDKQIPRLLLRLRGRTVSSGNFEAYSLYRMLLLRATMKTLKLKHYAYTQIKPNFHGHFLDLEPNRSKLLDDISTSNKYKLLKDSSLRIEGLVSLAGIVDKFNISTNSLKNAIRRLDMKPNRKVGVIHYYDRDQVAMIVQEAQTDRRKKEFK